MRVITSYSIHYTKLYDFATLWYNMAQRLGLAVDFVPGDWRGGVDPAAVEVKLAEDRGHKIKAVAVVHNETSTGVASRIGEVRAAMNRVGHPALLLVDTISSLARITSYNVCYTKLLRTAKPN